MDQQNDILTQVQEAQKPSELSVIASKINQGLEAFEKRKSELQNLKFECEGLTIESVEDASGISMVSLYRKKLKAERVRVEQEGKAMRDPLTQIARTIMLKENELIEIIEPTEKLLVRREAWVKQELDRMAQERQKAEEAIMQGRIDALAAYGYRVDLVLLKGITEEQFAATLASAKAEHVKELQRQAEEKRLAEEAAAQSKKDQEELAILRNNQAAALRIIDQENARIAKEQEEAESQRLIKLQEDERLNQSTDRQRFQAVAASLISIRIPAMKSKKAMKLHEEVRTMIDKIVEHITKNS